MYRGLHLSSDLLEEYKTKKEVYLQGYTSTSRNLDCALSFATQKEPSAGKVAVVFQISFRGHNGLFDLSDGYSAFPDENEVLL